MSTGRIQWLLLIRPVVPILFPTASPPKGKCADYVTGLRNEGEEGLLKVLSRCHPDLETRLSRKYY